MITLKFREKACWHYKLYMVKFSSKTQCNIKPCLTKIVRHHLIHRSSQKEIVKEVLYKEETEKEGVRCKKWKKH